MREKNISQTTLQAQLSALIMVPFIVGAWIAAYVLYGVEFFDGRDNVWTIISCILMLATIIPHELLHAAGWMLAAGKTKEEMKISIKLPFGASIRFYGKMRVSEFLVGAMFPFVFTSVIPAAVGIMTGNFYVLMYGTMLAMTCGSDIFLCIKAWKYRDCDCYDPGITGIVVEGVEA